MNCPGCGLKLAITAAEPLGRAKEILARRGRGIARAKADSSLKLAIVGDKRWGSMRKYARFRLQVSCSSLSDYEHGVSPCPAWVNQLVRADFPGLNWTWPGGIVE